VTVAILAGYKNYYYFSEYKILPILFSLTMSDKRFTGRQFETKQEETQARRLDLLPILGLKNGDEQWFELPIKKAASAFGGNVQELNDIANLDVVSPITLETTPTPIEVLNAARGTVVYKNKLVLVKSLPFVEEITMNELVTSADGTLEIDFPSRGQTSLPLSQLTFQEYHEGTMVRVIRVNGVTSIFTLRNLVPRGVKAPTTASGVLCDPTKSAWIHKPGRFGADHTTPFSTTFDRIIEEVEPRFYDEGFLFPKDSLFSPVCYRFVIVTRNVARANHRQIGPLGYLVYLGHTVEWTQSEWKSALGKESYGTWHLESDIPSFESFVSQPPSNPDDVYVLDASTPLSMEDHFSEARDILSGTIYRDVDVIGDIQNPLTAQKHSCGGKLLVTAKFARGPKLTTRTVAISSEGWKFREKLLGNTQDLYQQFVTLMSADSRPILAMSDPDAIAYFMNTYPIIRVPLNKEAGLALLTAIERKEILPCENESESYLYHLATEGKLHRIIWYNFLLAANISTRERVYRFWARYMTEIGIATEWLLTEHTKKFKGVKWEVNSTDEKRVISFMKRLEKDIMLLTKEEKYDVVVDRLRNGGNKAAAVVNLAVSYSGNKKKAIAIVECN